MPPEIGYEGKAVMVNESTYGTAVQGGALSAFPFLSFQDGKNISYVENNNISGSAFRRLMAQGTKLFTPGWSQDAFYAAGLPHALALLAGSDSPSVVQNSDPANVGADHLMVPQSSNLGISATVARLLNGVDTVKEFSGFKPQRIELTISAGGQLSVTVSGPCQNLVNTGATNTTGSIGSATFDAPLELIMYADMTVWYADQDGNAFDDNDKIHVDSVTWAWERGYKIDPGATSQLIREPVPSGFFATDFSMVLPLEEDLQPETDMLAGTAKRAHVQLSGPLLTDGDAGQNNEINLYLPALQVTENSDDVDGPEAISPSISFDVGEAETAPNDMNSQTVPHVIVRNELETAYV